MALGISTAIPFITVLLIGIQDVEAVQNAWIPSLEAFYQATGSKAVATALQACLAFLYYSRFLPSIPNSFSEDRIERPMDRLTRYMYIQLRYPRSGYLLAGLHGRLRGMYVLHPSEGYIFQRPNLLTMRLKRTPSPSPPTSHTSRRATTFPSAQLSSPSGSSSSLA